MDFMIPADSRRVMLTWRWPSPGRTEYFLNRSEDEIARWLRRWPPGRLMGDGTPDQLKHLAEAAWNLRRAIDGMGVGATAFVYLQIFRQEKDDFSGATWNEALKAARDLSLDATALANRLQTVAAAATSCRAHVGKALIDERDQDLCDELVRIFIDAFHRNPNSGETGLFKKFLDEIGGILPAGYGLNIGRLKIMQAIGHNSLWLESVHERTRSP